MSPHDWEKTNELFHRALELPENEREAFLRAHCADRSMREEINELLLAAHDAEADFLQASAFEAGLEFIAAPAAENFSGAQFGAYKIIGELGKGGMGAVYQAVRIDGAFERRAAIKILPRSSISEHLAARFGRERQILANLNHPFIAQLFDGGETRDGTPYFVMELVRGNSIIEFCRTRDLSIEERLKLFLKVCAAVSYAHAQGVVHRDLKPSNILICDDATPKLLDFGIAKFLSSEQSGDTTSGFSFLTPEYASPEQVSGKFISEQSDVYSLGIILYELLTEARPYDFTNRSPMGIAQVICESEPLAPSAKATERANRETQRDEGGAKFQTSNLKPKAENRKPINRELDHIVLKALRKDAARRYASVAEFADDIERFLHGFPVKAAPDALFYRAGKFAARRRAFSSALAAGLLAAAFLAAFSYWKFSQSSAVAQLPRKDSARRLTFNPAADSYPQILADGSVAFIRMTKSVERLRTGDDAAKFYLIDSDGANERPLNERLFADRGKFSPDGRQFVFRNTLDYRLYIADADFKTPAQKLTRFAAGRPAWSPNGRRIAFCYNLSEKLEQPSVPLYRDADNVEIFAVDSTGGAETNLTNNPAFDSDASISPDGAKIVFTSNRDGNFEIYLMNADGSNQTRLTTNDVDDAQPAFSPDGKRIAFVSRRSEDNDEIYLMDADGANVRRVTFASGNDHEPQWSPDGKSIAFAYDADGKGEDEIYIIDVPPQMSGE